MVDVILVFYHVIPCYTHIYISHPLLFSHFVFFSEYGWCYVYIYILYYSFGWWFGTCFFFHILGIIIPTDFHIFQTGRHTTNQSRLIILYVSCYPVNSFTTPIPLWRRNEPQMVNADPTLEMSLAVMGVCACEVGVAISKWGSNCWEAC